MSIIRMGDAGGSWAPMTGGNTLGTSAPAMAPYDPTAVRPAARIGQARSASELAALAADQSRVCAAARRMSERYPGSPSASALLRQCEALRSANLAKGVFVPEGGPVDAPYRVLLDHAGAAVLAARPQLAQLAAQSTSPRVFSWAAAVARGQAAPGYVAWLAGPAIGNSGAPLNPDPGFRGAFEGFLRVMRPTTQAAKPDDGGLPPAVLIGGGFVVVGGIAWAVWKFLL